MINPPEQSDASISDADFSDGMTTALGTVQGWVIDFYARLPNLIVGFALLMLFGLLAYGAGRFIQTYFTRKNREDLGNILSSLGFWGFMLIGTLIAITVIMPSVDPADLLASLGIGSIAVGFAFKDILQNWFSGLLILLRMPFRRGDQINVLDAEGTVMRIEPRATILRTYDGRDMVIPNTMIFSNMVTVHTSQPQRRVEMDFTVGYDYEVRMITRIIQQALTQIDEILKDPAPQVMCWELGSTSLGLKLRWWIESDRSQEVISRARAVQAIKEAFEANEIDPTDPQLIFYQELAKGAAKDKNSRQAKVKSENGFAEAMPPPVFEASAKDPELDIPKVDAKEKTMLTETEDPKV